MSTQITITGQISLGQGILLISGNLNFTGTYTASGSGGETLDFSKATQDPAFQGAEFNIQNSGSGPLRIDVISGTGIFNTYVATPGAAINNSKLKISTTTFNTEVTNGSAYPEASASFLAIFKQWL